MGDYALYNNLSRSNLVAIGDSALFNNGVGASFATDAVQKYRHRIEVTLC